MILLSGLAEEEEKSVAFEEREPEVGEGSDWRVVR